MVNKNQILFIPCEYGTAGGSLQGSLFASFAHLREMFGDPAFEGKGDNITTEFVIDYEWYDNDEDVEYGSFSLYDWHYGRDFADDYKVIKWNIGGKGFSDSYAATLAQKLFEKTDIRCAHDDACLAHANWHDLNNPDLDKETA